MFNVFIAVLRQEVCFVLLYEFIKRLYVMIKKFYNYFTPDE